MADSITDKAIERFAEMMVRKMETLSTDWKKPWFSTTGSGQPQNLSGRPYSRLNELFLLFLTEEMKYKTPVFMTFLQAKEENVLVKKGEKSFPVLFYSFSVREIATGKKIPFDEYSVLPKEEKENYKVTPFLKVHYVFNIDQSTFPEQYPERYEELLVKFKVLELNDENGMIKSPQLDALIQNNAWLCPVYVKNGDSAYYSPARDTIHVPLKAQFESGESFYATLLHEMTHSTGIESRLNRNMTGRFGDASYGREELVAELTAALMCRELGISSTIRDESVAYLKGWIEMIRKEPQFLFSTLSDVGKAAIMIEKEVLSQKNNLELVATELVDKGKIENLKVVKYIDAYASLPFGQIGDLDSHGITSDETGRKIRWAAKLSDGRIVSLDGTIRILKPDVWNNIKEYLKRLKGVNKNQAIIEYSFTKAEFEKYLDDIYINIKSAGYEMKDLYNLSISKKFLGDSLIDGLYSRHIIIEGKPFSPEQYLLIKEDLEDRCKEIAPVVDNYVVKETQTSAILFAIKQAYVDGFPVIYNSPEYPPLFNNPEGFREFAQECGFSTLDVMNTFNTNFKEIKDFINENLKTIITGNYQGNSATQQLNYDVMQIDEQKINWQELSEKHGLSREALQKAGVLDQLLQGRKSNQLVELTYESQDGPRSFNAKVRFYEKDGEIKLAYYPVRQAPELDKPYFGYEFTDQDRKNLLETGNLGHTTEIERNGEKVNVLISVDKLTNDLVHADVDRLKLQNEIKGVALTEEQKSFLLSGKPVMIKDMISNAGNKFSSYVMINAETRSLEFVSLKPNVVEDINQLKELNGVAISDENRKILSEGGSVFVEGMTSRDGREYSANIKYDPEAKRIRYEFPETNQEGIRIPNSIKGVALTEDQKTKLEAGEEVYLKDMTSSNGKKFSNFIYLDKEEKKIKFKPFEDKSQKKSEVKEVKEAPAEKKSKGKSVKM